MLYSRIQPFWIASQLFFCVPEVSTEDEPQNGLIIIEVCTMSEVTYCTQYATLQAI